jgi:hypothetical protein
MVRQTVDERRREIIRAAAAGIGMVGTARRASGSTTVGKGRRGSSMTDVGEASRGPDFLVHKHEGTTLASRWDEDRPVFDGSAGAVIQRAIDAGEASGSGTLVAIESGSYELERPVALAPSTWLAGAGSATAFRAADGLNADLLTVPSGAAHVRVSDIRIEGNGTGNRRGDAVVVEGGAWRPVIEHLVVRDAPGHGIRFTAGPDEEYSYEPTLSDIDVARCGGDGFVFGHTGDVFGVNLYAEACGGYGFTMADAGGTFVHPHAYDIEGEAGIRITESAKDLAMFGPHAERNRRHGILIRGERVTVRNGFVANNSRDAPGSYDGLTLDGARDSLVSESALLNDLDRDRAQRHGIVETAASRRNVVSGNLFRNNTAAPVERPRASTGSRYRDNRGYRTAGGGEATVRDGGRIHHGLDERPTQYSVESTSPGVYAHAVDVDESSITVEVLSLDGGARRTSPVDVSWGAVARQR